ncbi:MAG: pilus assembly protein PilM [bacterium]
MKTISDYLKRFQRGHADVVGFDMACSGIKVVRLRRAHAAVSVVAADILPLPSTAGADSPSITPFVLPKLLRARYMAMASSEQGAIIKLLTVPSHSEKSMDAYVNELMGLTNNAEYRLAYEQVAVNRSEHKILAAGMPVQTVESLCGLFPSGTPAPCSIEVSGLASMTAFMRGPGKNHSDDCVAVIDFGARTTLVAFYHKGAVVMIRKFDMGAANILKKLQDNLGVDSDVALGILNDSSFDISRIVHQAMESLLQQLTISWDFVERREGTRIVRLYACGGGTSGCWAREVQAATGQEPVLWNPFDGLNVTAEVLSKWKGQESRFSAAIGAALGAMEAS